ncbi:hypothetical protein DPMN_051682 [Dreissena polymorpha]|uniref:Sushi domain-containing protein n=1 Tax=Dreissena polymorpha TaxID=45954 RepID=A0A9D4HP48_DREPO|nr:hypothetical protein DPMN_051682 [Dreissena polymorpha]
MKQALSNCGTLSKPLNGSVSFVPNTEYLSQAEFECDIGYCYLSGNKTRTCTDSGRSAGVWAGTSPTCVIKVLSNPSNGKVDLSNGTKYQSTAVYTSELQAELARLTKHGLAVNRFATV